MNTEQARGAAARIMARCDELAAISEHPEHLTRVYLSPEHLRANQCVGQWMQAAGMRVWQDSVGNICGRYEGQQAGAPAVLLGSHLDTVRNAGRYDGMLGVVSAIEAVHHLNAQGIRLPLAIEVVGFADEEGTRFGITLLGSRGLAGTWPAEWADTQDAEGTRVAEAMAAVGLDIAQVASAARPREQIAAYLELHIEQGPCLEREDLALGVVTAINGARRLNCTFTGHAGHAGTVPMRHRQDALAAAAHWMAWAEQHTLQAPGQQVATFGTLQCYPGAVNVIPGEVKLSLDIRGPESPPLERLLAELLAHAEQLAQARGLSFTAEEFYRIEATGCDPRLQHSAGAVLERVQGRSFSLPSGAGHDAIALAEHWPSAMLFVRCAGGVSHHPAEAVSAEDVGLAVQAYTHWITDVANATGA